MHEIIGQGIIPSLFEQIMVITTHHKHIYQAAYAKFTAAKEIIS